MASTSKGFRLNYYIYTKNNQANEQSIVTKLIAK